MNHEGGLILSAIIIMLLNLIYLKPAIDGITKRRMTMRGLTSINFRHSFHLKGTAAFLMGMFLIACDVLFIVGWITWAITLERTSL